MPTNTHTFFYNQKIGDVVTQDIKITQGYLSQLESRQVTLPAYVNSRTKCKILDLY